MRTTLTRLTIVAGVVIAASSFALALSPRLPVAPPTAVLPAVLARPIPYLPAFFILGIMLMFVAAVIYELLPDHTDRQDPPEYQLRRSE